MKKAVIFLFIISILIIPPCSSQVAYAEETKENLDETVNDALDNIDLSGYDELLTLLNEYSDFSFSKSARQIIDDIIHGNAEPTFSYFFNSFIGLLGSEVAHLLPEMIILIIISVVFGILKNLNSGFKNKGTEKIVFLACYALIITVIGYLIVDTVKYANNVFSFLKKFNDICFPVLLTLVTALGGSATVAVYQPYVLIFSNTLITLITTIIMPLFYVTFVFGIVGNLSKNLNLNKFSKVAKSISEWILGIVFGTFITLLTTQGIIGAGMDGLAARGAKYALSSYVPVIGNYLKDGFDIILASCMVVKNAVGLCAILILLGAVLIPVIKLLILSFGLKLVSAIAEPLSDKGISDMINTTADSLKILIIAVICAGISLLLALMLIIYTCNPGVL